MKIKDKIVDDNGDEAYVTAIRGSEVEVYWIEEDFQGGWWPMNGFKVLEEAPTDENNGGATAYYDFPEGFKTLNDLIEYKDMPFWRGNIFKATFRLGEKDVATEEYDLNKIVYFANRRLAMLKKEKE